MAEARVCTAAELQEHGRRVVDVNGRRVGVFRVNGELRAYANVCPHQGGPVCQGRVMRRVTAVLGPDREVVLEAYDRDRAHIVCPWHGWEFDIDSGRCVADSRYALRRYEVVQRGEDIYVVD